MEERGRWERFHRTVMAAPELRRELEARGIPTFSAEIPRLKAFEKAAAAGVPVSEVSDQRAARAWQAYESIGKEIIHGRK